MLGVLISLAGQGAARAQAQARSSGPAPLLTGLSGLPSAEPLVFQRIAAAGARFVRIDVAWGKIAPARQPDSWAPTDPADPNYNWSGLDPYVIGAVGAGLTPVLTVVGAPSWAQVCSTAPLCDPAPAMFAAFATAAAIRYSGHFEGLPRVRYWQALNEPNLSLFFNPQLEAGNPVSPTLYRALVNAFYFAVKSVERSDLVLAAGLGPIANPPYTIGPMLFTRLLLCMQGARHPHPIPGDCEGGVHFDIFDIHPYTTGGPKHAGGAENVELGSLGRLQRLLAAADRAGRIHGRFKQTPLWITEFSWDSKPPDPGGLPMSILARWTSEALYDSWRIGVTHFFWFSLRDNPTNGQSFAETVQSGLYLRGPSLAEDRPKQRLIEAFRFPLVAYRRKGGVFFWGRTPNSLGGEITIQLHVGGRWRSVGLLRAAPNGIFSGSVRGGEPSDRRGAVRARFRGETTIPFSLQPVKEFLQPPFGKP